LPIIPKLFLVKAAQQKITHCVMNKGYRIRNGGVGTVSIIEKAQPMLIAQAVTSRAKRNGHSRKSALIHCQMSFTTLKTGIKESCPLFPE
jgi:hypothetical protein